MVARPRLSTWVRWGSTSCFPLAASLSALQVAIALTCKSFKEAQVRNQILSMAVPMAPMLLMFNTGREPAWFQWAPVVAQNVMMNHVLKGEAVGMMSIGISARTASG